MPSCRSLVSAFPVSQPTMSHHLKELVTAGLIDERQEGQAKFYRARRDVLKAYLDDTGRALGALHN